MRNIRCFHNPDEINGYLSNWYISEFVKNGIRYTSMEQYMMHQKALLFLDYEIAGQIMGTTNVGKIKALGRAVKSYDDVIWNGMCIGAAIGSALISSFGILALTCGICGGMLIGMLIGMSIKKK